MDTLYTFLQLQSLIVSGFLKIELEEGTLTLSKDTIVVNLLDRAKGKRLLSALQPTKGLKDVLLYPRELGALLSSMQKTLILKYHSREILILGYGATPGIFGMKNVEIRNRLTFLKFLFTLL